MFGRVQTALTVLPVTFILLVIAVAAGAPHKHATGGHAPGGHAPRGHASSDVGPAAVYARTPR